MSYSLHIRDFPQELLTSLKLEAVAEGVTLKALVVGRLSESTGGKRMPQKPNKRESGAFGEKVESEAVRQEVKQTAITHAVGCRCYTCKPPK